MRGGKGFFNSVCIRFKVRSANGSKINKISLSIYLLFCLDAKK